MECEFIKGKPMPRHTLLNDRRGEMTFGGLVLIIILAVTVYAGWKFTGPVVRYVRTGYMVEEYVLKAKLLTDQRIRKELMRDLKAINIPDLQQKTLTLKWDEKKFTVKVQWVEKITFPGGLEFVWQIVRSDTKSITKSKM